MIFGETTYLDYPVWGVTNCLGSEYTIGATNEGDRMAKEKADEQVIYRIKVQGRLDDRWSEWFSGLTITVESDAPPITTMTGVIDQAALRGILNKVWDLNLALVSVNPVEESGSKADSMTDAKRLSCNFWII
jgi:hypothetical protein